MQVQKDKDKADPTKVPRPLDGMGDPNLTPLGQSREFPRNDLARLRHKVRERLEVLVKKK